MKLLVTGGCGFLGSNLASNALKLGIDVIVFDNLSRFGSIDNLNWLQSQGKLTFVHGDIRNKNDVTHVITKYMPDNIFHLAGQVAMTTSIDNPQMDFEVNVGGTFNLLEAVRRYNPDCGIIYSSTNKVYGDLEQYTYHETETRYGCVEKPNGFDESTQLNFHSPYGCSKGAADQYMLDYARIFGLKTVVFRHSSMYGGRQFATYDQGWVGWFCQKALAASRGNGSVFTISGNGKQVRDVLHAEDMISLYFSTLIRIPKISGQAFNIGGGFINSLSLIELFNLLQEISGTTLNYEKLAPRESDQKVFVADVSKISHYVEWMPKVTSKEGVKKMFDWCASL
ncbi:MULTISPECIES: NAD-dependent epimerase/dehydratase family protein [unclassified Photorhabdus]|uniref:NAD-dependent epimerase/dehydratase family protein n=1 Tax=unclassified Photorhabdus TaxID=2620880 RepID=UPI000DCD444B|nr:MULTISPECIES: NAD-dependent epimerase/dehydratase family protein [unclassified Photorhabdus]RAW98438.1 CDP-paratose 2-epimerase [Photorhabdus sp. S10-54]RAW98552.1 CDP-paratose 2-epimerase [Photorhabdus sp. S9-53]RAX02753.1 CDP-paratose 2-epimerase [Photorhabdus sp. S8-52]